MNHIEILEVIKNHNHRKDSYLFLHVEKFMVEQYFDWLSLDIRGNYLQGEAYLSPKGCTNNYQVQIYYSPFLLSSKDKRYDRIYIKKPNIKFNPKIHMYGDTSLCLYYPNDNLNYVPLFKSLTWTSEWLIKYEYFQQTGTWIGNEVEH